MKNLILLTLFLFSLFSCTKEETPPKGPTVPFASCEEMLDITGLNLYPFEPRMEEEYFHSFVKKRQIPEDFLRGMSTKELIYQTLRLEMFLFGGDRINVTTFTINIVNNFNMVAELLSRPDAGRELVHILQRIDPSVIKWEEDLEPTVDCYYFYECVQGFVVLPEIIGRMSDEEIDLYIDEQLRLYNLVLESPTGVQIPACTGYGLLGLCYAMMRHEFEPFMQLLVMNRNFLGDVMSGRAKYMFAYTSSIMDCIEQFKNREK